MSTTSTKQRLLSAAQAILAESGLAAVNSNAIVERAKVTPPTFYHYFKNKKALLRELGEELMLAQTRVLRADTGLRIANEQEMFDVTLRFVTNSFERTVAFEGGFALLVALRALPELADIRLQSHADMAMLIVDFFDEQGLCKDREDLLIRARVGLETSYAANEMLFETGFENREKIHRLTAEAIVRIYGLF
ncbi:MAG: TetR/AcrR family transcriptional regulator [Erythrobacter sp.]|nr:TetR/AcrR family transcriptional regulator [Erythrobacter sp.]NCQ64936.1 TetR/AcrR family transcriptional regulator [Alphaproteobacteria bacterium]